MKMTAENVNLWYGDFHALKGVSLNMEVNQVTALIKIILLLFFQNQEPILIVFFQEPSHSKVTKRNQRYA